MMGMDIDIIFKKYFPKMNFDLKDFQKTICQNILNQSNTLCIMPTGGGKSIIYWLSGLALNGITIVISPLIALIDEQSNKIQEQGYNVLTIHGGMSANKQIDLLTKFAKKELNPHFIFVSPERIATDGFFEYCLIKRKEEIKLLTIDEIHCVSQWGFDFRPFYKRIPDFLNNVFEINWPTILGLTATLNPKEIIDICHDLKISKEQIFKDDLLIRGEIDIRVLKFSDENTKEEKLWQLLDIHKNEKTLVYLYRKYHKRGTEELKDIAIEKGYHATNFHGDMTSLERQSIIDSFKNGSINLIFATNAFGMGIDIPDIRVIIHFMIPESVEQFYQEIGRAARDGEASKSYVLYTNKNIQVRKTHFIDKSFPDANELESIHKKITGNKKGLKTLKYFDDEKTQKCLPYFLENDIISIAAKGFTNLDIFSEIKDNNLQEIFDSTKTKGIVSTIKKTNIPPCKITELVYSNVLNNESKLSKVFDKCLIIDNHHETLSNSIINKIEESISVKRSYKHDLLNYFTYLLNDYNSSKELHQEIGLYLGVDKHKLNKIYKTRKSDLVRSKSEVIIANLLFDEKIKYEYEKKLYFEQNKWIEPDFTIFINGTEFYWEHLGMIGIEDYDKRWLKKRTIYDKYFPGKLKITYESAVLTDSALAMIGEFKKLS